MGRVKGLLDLVTEGVVRVALAVRWDPWMHLSISGVAEWESRKKEGRLGVCSLLKPSPYLTSALSGRWGC